MGGMGCDYGCDTMGGMGGVTMGGMGAHLDAVALKPVARAAVEELIGRKREFGLAEGGHVEARRVDGRPRLGGQRVDFQLGLAKDEEHTLPPAAAWAGSARGQDDRNDRAAKLRVRLLPLRRRVAAPAIGIGVACRLERQEPHAPPQPVELREARGVVQRRAAHGVFECMHVCECRVQLHARSLLRRCVLRDGGRRGGPLGPHADGCLVHIDHEARREHDCPPRRCRVREARALARPVLPQQDEPGVALERRTQDLGVIGESSAEGGVDGVGEELALRRCTRSPTVRAL